MHDYKAVKSRSDPLSSVYRRDTGNCHANTSRCLQEDFTHLHAQEFSSSTPTIPIPRCLANPMPVRKKSSLVEYISVDLMREGNVSFEPDDIDITGIRRLD